MQLCCNPGVYGIIIIVDNNVPNRPQYHYVSPAVFNDCTTIALYILDGSGITVLCRHCDHSHLACEQYPKTINQI